MSASGGCCATNGKTLASEASVGFFGAVASLHLKRPMPIRRFRRCDRPDRSRQLRLRPILWSLAVQFD